ncbi:hypothetical protein XELAEV_18031682mg [Xenopus laevis]|uniref:Uncharacterized protein n=1 Tax=Xenopus laevis TaxID=8355 RepID=A0A974CN12_XENLA|nr:hypothetical protein XELAEV_18031682mg [Xenopus laevis]
MFQERGLGIGIKYAINVGYKPLPGFSSCHSRIQRTEHRRGLRAHHCQGKVFNLNILVKQRIAELVFGLKFLKRIQFTNERMIKIPELH